MSEPVYLDAIVAEKEFRISKRKSEVVIYYRKPLAENGRRSTQAGWIIWGDSQPNKRSDYIFRGFRPLQFGRGRKFLRVGGGEAAFDEYGPWGPILSHPDGPAMFPVDQVITNRWYIPEQCPVPGVVFPQLAGVKIIEYGCPDCQDRTFLHPNYLARHLRNAHSYTMADIIQLGSALGVNFKKEFSKANLERVIEMPGVAQMTADAAASVEANGLSFEDELAAYVEPDVEAEPDTAPVATFEVETVRTRAKAAR